LYLPAIPFLVFSSPVYSSCCCAMPVPATIFLSVPAYYCLPSAQWVLHICYRCRPIAASSNTCTTSQVCLLGTAWR
jgi:hypothetical protein